MSYISRSYFQRIISGLFSTRSAGMYMLFFAAAIGIATFIENDFGTSAAQKVIYKQRWFELLLVLFAGSILFNVRRYRMIQNKKWGTLMFHLSVLVILLGAGVTRYYGFEGMMHIREGSSSDSFLSAEEYLQFQISHQGQVYRFDEPVLFASLGDNHFDQTYQIGDEILKIALTQFIPNPKEELSPDANGAAYIKLVFGSARGRREVFLREGLSQEVDGQRYYFGPSILPGAVNFKYQNDSLLIHLPTTFNYRVMATQETGKTGAGTYEPLRLRALYNSEMAQFVVGDFNPSAQVDVVSEKLKMQNDSRAGLVFNVQFDGVSNDMFVLGQKGLEGKPTERSFNQSKVSVQYGAKRKFLPFSIFLRDFQMEKYPGTNNASSYASTVKLIDKAESVSFDYRIFMNNILDYKGYRFFQSSFDQDELGTYLSVNHDWWGTWISYLGYFLLTLGMIITLFDKKSRFRKLSQQLKKHQTNKMLLLLIVTSLYSGIALSQENIISAGIDFDHAQQMESVIVQDPKGRMKPFNTLAEELLRKISRKESLYGLSAEQIVLDMYHNNKKWYHIQLIKNGKNEKLHQLIGSDEKLLRYDQFFEQSGTYKLRTAVRQAFAMNAADRSTFEKELMKIDERLNITSMIFEGRLFRWLPMPGDENNRWLSEAELKQMDDRNPNVTAFMKEFYPNYHFESLEAMGTGDWSGVHSLIHDLKAFQAKYGRMVLPSASQVKAELILNKWDFFDRLSLGYGVLGILFVFLLFIGVFKTQWNIYPIFSIAFYLALALFLCHTAALGLRWYVSERAPWSNGYESMIYIAWTSVLAGLIFARRAIGGMAATMILASTILLVAMLSYLDPEITPLVPVLNSYWLTIHVSLEAGSYGFLLLGAIIGLLNLFLIAFANQNNKGLIKEKVSEMSKISEMTLIGGLFMISIGTYLGGVWANESWGRYWGWDAKETWALVTILVYSFILHMRFIPGVRGLLAYNVASLFGWASVIMTYYGVNYYLSGLHSYAAGDPAPIPMWVYSLVIACITISLIAWYKNTRVKMFGN